MRKKLILLTIAFVAMIGCTMTVSAAPKEMPDGTVFDAEYYALNNPDVVEALGTSEDALYQHYVTYGKAEGRKPCGAVVVTQKSLDDANELHQYYTGIPAEYAELSDIIANHIADEILSNPEYKTDCQKIDAAAKIIKYYCDNSIYGADDTKYYRSPVGLFSTTFYTCAGSTRALGRVLDYMGYEWTHTNENENRHQWCVVTMDGQIGWADGMAGFAGYGELKNGMTMPDGSIAVFAE